MAEDRPDRSALLFLSLVAGLGQAAYQQLGKLQNPLTGKVERDLGAARATIDTLAALESRTRGNLSEDESTLLGRTLAELRLNYVDEAKKTQETTEPKEQRPEAATAEAPPAEAAPAETTPSAPAGAPSKATGGARAPETAGEKPSSAG